MVGGRLTVFVYLRCLDLISLPILVWFMQERYRVISLVANSKKCEVQNEVNLKELGMEFFSSR